jgi:hypothetical protein
VAIRKGGRSGMATAETNDKDKKTRDKIEKTGA